MGTMTQEEVQIFTEDKPLCAQRLNVRLMTEELNTSRGNSTAGSNRGFGNEKNERKG